MPSRLNIRQKVFELLFKARHSEHQAVLSMTKDFLDGNLTHDQLKEKYEVKNPKLPTLAASDLDAEQIQKTLGLKPTTDDDELDFVPFIIPPAELTSVLAKVNSALSKSPKNEANIRFTVDLLFVYAHDIATSQPNRGQTISIQAEKLWVLEPVRHEKQKYALVGRPDYAVWYGDANEVAVNMVVMEAKSPYEATRGIPQCLAYMGMVHRLRKREKKKNCTVYGLSTDACSFIFLKIDDNSKWSMVSRTAPTGDFKHVLGMLVYLLKKASHASPMHSKEHSKEGSGDSSIYATEDQVMGNM